MEWAWGHGMMGGDALVAWEESENGEILREWAIGGGE